MNRAVALATNDLAGQGEWFTSAELAELRLPGLPTDKRSINRRALEDRWASRPGADGLPLVRARMGRGGGVEFHVSLLPPSARLELTRRGISVDPSQPAAALPEAENEEERGWSWRWLERQPAKVRAEAEDRLRVVGEIELLEKSGLTRTSAIAEIAATHDLGRSTLWQWLAAVEGVGASDRLPALAPRRKGGGSNAAMDGELWTMFLSDFLRPSAPTLTSCYDRVGRIAVLRGLSMPSERTLRRRLEREVDPAIVRLKREGVEALRRSIPSGRRDVTQLHALEVVNIDGHKFDVFVISPTTGKPIRPMMVGIQDVRSGKVLAHRVGETESAHLARLTFADLFRDWGIPVHCLLDNGRGFASKLLSGGAKTRFRYKIKEEEAAGLLTALGINIHWALPYRGQSKPIERAWRDLADTISRHPATEGAYTGPNPMAKPENYAKRAMEWDAFLAHVAEGIALHNARLGRKGRDYAGRSFDQVFAESYATAPIQKATAEQLRMALLAAEQKLVDRRTGEVNLFRNRYWSPECGDLKGQRVTVRFDPDYLHGEVHLYAQNDGRFLCTAPVIDDSGFMEASGAKASGKRWADYHRSVRAGEAAYDLLRAEEVAAMQAPVAGAPKPEASVIRAVRPLVRPHRHGGAQVAIKAQPEFEIDAARPNRSRNVLRLIGDAE